MKKTFKLKNGQSVSITTEKVVITNPDDTRQAFPLFADRMGSKASSTTETKVSIGHFGSSIKGTVDLSSVRYKSGIISGVFSGYKMEGEGDDRKFVKYESNFTFDINTGKLKEKTKIDKAKKLLGLNIEAAEMKTRKKI